MQRKPRGFEAVRVDGLIRDDEQIGVALVAHRFGPWQTVWCIASQNDDGIYAGRWLSVFQQDAGEGQPDGDRKRDQYKRQDDELSQGSGRQHAFGRLYAPSDLAASVFEQLVYEPDGPHAPQYA